MKRICKSESNKEAKTEDDSPRNSTMENMPREIALDILSRLRITSLLQAKWACKSWRSVAQDPLLVPIHFSRMAENDPCLLLHVDLPTQNYFYSLQFSDSDDRLAVETVTRIGVPMINDQFFVLGSCNGLLFLWNSLHNDQGYVYNPFTRNFFELPKPEQFPSQHRVASGFGFCPETKEYKVVRIVYYRTNDEIEAPNLLRPLPKSEIQVLTVGNGGFTWRNKGEASYQVQGKPSHVLLNGRLHWLSLRYRDNWLQTIVCFDLSDENVRQVPSPRHGMFRRRCTHLVNLRGCVSAVVQGFNRLHIWVMKEYGFQDSWSIQFRISINGQLDPCSDQSITVFNLSQVRALCLFKNGYILLEHRCKDLVAFDPKSGMFKELMLPNLPQVFNAVVHIGSLNWIQNPIDL